MDCCNLSSHVYSVLYDINFSRNSAYVASVIILHVILHKDKIFVRDNCKEQTSNEA